MSDTIPLGTYIFERIKQLGVGSIFGVPGDFNLAFLDHVDEVEGLRWVGNANELNAAYAADGYARINGFAALVTTFGVGELSAINGVAGAYAEHVGLIHIVGTPTISSEENHLLLHHTLGDSRFDIFSSFSKNITTKSAHITSMSSAPGIVDELLTTGFLKKRPVYLALPSNFVDEPVPKKLLDTPLDLNFPKGNVVAEAELVLTVLAKIKAAKKPAILVDACAGRHDVRDVVAEISHVTKFPVFVTPMGKSSFDEDDPRYGGVYIGELSKPDVKAAVEDSDLILSIGGLLSDYNTGAFTYHYHTTNIVEFHSDYCKVRAAVFPRVMMQNVLPKIVEGLKKIDIAYTPTALPESINDYKKVLDVTSGKLTQEYLWKRLSFFLKPKDIVVAETGTSSFGIVGTHYPQDVTAISQVLWGSIGYSLPAAVGATFAAQEIDKSKRVILYIGDGSLQLTVQAISDACRWNLPTYIFVLNNSGYTIEKLIHGLHADYNQIQPWDHQKLIELFHGSAKFQNYRVSTIEELDELYKDDEFNVPDRIRLIELMLDELDAPKNLIEQAKLSEDINKN